jgi:hypothetical protein
MITGLDFMVGLFFIRIELVNIQQYLRQFIIRTTSPDHLLKLGIDIHPSPYFSIPFGKKSYFNLYQRIVI